MRIAIVRRLRPARKSALAPVLTEMAIIVTVARPASGATTSRRSGRGAPPRFTDPNEALMFGFVSQLPGTNDVDDEVFGQFREHFGDRGVVEVTALMGYYAVIGYPLNAARFLPQGNPLPKLRGSSVHAESN